MTDLERAYVLVMQNIEAAFAAARREGYDEAAKEYVEMRRRVYEDGHTAGAEEMRERAAAKLRQMASLSAPITTDKDTAIWWAHYRQALVDGADAIRALPLTPEEPTLGTSSEQP